MKKSNQTEIVRLTRVGDPRKGDALRAPRFDQQPACRFCGEDCNGFH